MNIFVFECNDETQYECLQRNLFGGKSAIFSTVKTGDICLLFNFWGLQQNITGVFEAICDGTKNIIPEAWQGSRGYPFPYQVRVKLVSKEKIVIPRNNLGKYVTDPDSHRVLHKIYGDRAQELLQYFAGGYTAKIEAGNQAALYEEDYRLKYPRQYHCIDGHDVRSLSEQSIDDWLSTNQVYHEYERLSNIPERLIPDFTLYSRDGRPVFVEYWGLMDDPTYQARRLKKCQIYAKYQCALIELYLNDIKNLDFALRKKLTEHNISFGR